MRFSENSLLTKGKLSQNENLNKQLAKALNIKDGAEKILRVSSSTTQRLDIYKTLLVANAKIFNFMRLIQQENVEYAKSKRDSPEELLLDYSVDVPTAKLCIKKIKVPLIWTFNVWNSNIKRDQISTNVTLDESAIHMKNYNRGMSFFCLLQVNGEIKETKIISDVYPGHVDLEFDDVIIFNDVRPDFALVIEIFMHDPHFTRERSLKGGSGGSLRRNLKTNSFINHLDRQLSKHISQDENSGEMRKRPINIPNPFHKSYYQDIVEDHIRKNQLHLISTPASKLSSCFKLLGRVLITKEQLNSKKTLSHMIDIGPRLNYTIWPTRQDIINSHLNDSSIGNEGTVIMQSSVIPPDEPTLSEHGRPLFGVIGAHVFAQVKPREKFIKSGFLLISIIQINILLNVPKEYFVVLSNCQLLAFRCDENFPDTLKCNNHSPVEIYESREPDLKINIDKTTEIFLRSSQTGQSRNLAAKSSNQIMKSSTNEEERPCIDMIASFLTFEDTLNSILLRDANGVNNTLSMMRVEISQRHELSLDDEIKELNDWINCVNRQIDEKMIWSNEDVFDDSIIIPTATSLSRNGSVKSSFHIDY